MCVWYTHSYPDEKETGLIDWNYRYSPTTPGQDQQVDGKARKLIMVGFSFS